MNASVADGESVIEVEEINNDFTMNYNDWRDYNQQ